MTNENIVQVVRFIKDYLKTKINETTAEDLRIIYSGEFTKINIKQLAQEENLDGILVFFI